MIARWVGRGGLWLEHDGHGLLVGAPAGAAEDLGDALGCLRAIALPVTRPRDVGGLLTLLAALEPWRRDEEVVELHVALGDERGPALAEGFAAHWDGAPLTIDAQRAGASLHAGPFAIETRALTVGEPRWRPPRIEGRAGLALRVTAGDRRVAIVRGARPEPWLARWCAGADLAVVEIGVTPWPRADRPWRLRQDEALAIGAGARELWIAGDDGERVGAAEG